jgi:hypothetical protein
MFLTSLARILAEKSRFVDAGNAIPNPDSRGSESSENVQGSMLQVQLSTVSDIEL